MWSKYSLGKTQYKDHKTTKEWKYHEVELVENFLLLLLKWDELEINELKILI